MDNLHELAGSKKVYHIHGDLLRSKCDACKKTLKDSEETHFPNECKYCFSVNKIRPDVVFFKKPTYFSNEAEILVNNAKVLISIGASGLVYPAAFYVMMAKRNGALCLEINPNETNNEDAFHLNIKQKAGECLPWVVDELISAVKKK